MMKQVVNALLLTTLTASPAVFLTQARAQQGIPTERVQFPEGKSSAVVEGSITGYKIKDYVLKARKGQYMNVSMATDNGANYFNILAPGESDEAMFNGSGSQNLYEGILPKTGDYKVRVYLMRSAARRGEAAKYRLEMIITEASDEMSLTTPSGDGLVEGTNYHATGKIPCAMNISQPKGSCSFGVTRKGNGSGTVTVAKPDGRIREILFERGTATGYDMNQTDPAEFNARREADMTIIRIGEELYEIPDAVIFGG